MGFEELPHTADWSIRVWAEDLPQLFAEAGRALIQLEGIKLTNRERVTRKFETSAQDPESLLVSFLSELIYYQERDQLAFDEFQIRITDMQLEAEMRGRTIQSIQKAIKAITYHNLNIRKTRQGLEVEIVMDV